MNLLACLMVWREAKVVVGGYDPLPMASYDEWNYFYKSYRSEVSLEAC